MTQNKQSPDDEILDETVSDSEEPTLDTEADSPETLSVNDLLNQEAKEATDYKDKYLRLLAEMDNTRKRMQKEKKDMMRFSVENVISEFLLPIDNLEKALQCTTGLSAETLNWVKGFEMIAAQFKEVVSQNGVEGFASVGETFDPHIHEAVEVEETDEHPEGTILEEYIKGYKSDSRTVRPARVKVAKKVKTEQDS